MTADLSEIVLNNLEYFQRAEVKSGQRLHQLFQHLSEVLEKIKPIITKFELFVKDYDFNDATPGNGYRSFLFVLDSAVKCSLRNCVNVKENREKFFFRKSFYEKYLSGDKSRIRI